MKQIIIISLAVLLAFPLAAQNRQSAQPVQAQPTQAQPVQAQPVQAQPAQSGQPSQATTAATAPANEQRVLLGTLTANFRNDRDTLQVGNREGSFTRLVIEVENNSANIDSIIVHYQNGQSDTISIRQNFQDGNRSRSIDLTGRNRIITSVDFLYSTSGRPGDGRAQIQLYGLR